MLFLAAGLWAASFFCKGLALTLQSVGLHQLRMFLLVFWPPPAAWHKSDVLSKNTLLLEGDGDYLKQKVISFDDRLYGLQRILCLLEVITDEN
jgi:hypothetical protein